MKILYWLRNDLRTLDNSALTWALSQSQQITAVFVFPSSLSVHQKKFLKETLQDLKTSLRQHRIDLVVHEGDPVLKIPECAEALDSDLVIWTREWNARDQRIEKLIQKKLKTRHQSFDQRTLVDPEQLSFSIEDLPKTFTPFYRGLNFARSVPPVPHINLATVGASEEMDLGFTGGETAGLRHLYQYLSSRAIDHYKESRNGMINWSDSSKLSPWLANGSLSPRRIYAEIKKHESDFGANDSTTALIYELVWRDYFKFYAHLAGEKLFALTGIKGRGVQTFTDQDLVHKWQRGQTESDFVNANMRELYLKGWMSNRGRQNVASYFAKTLKQDWREGALWFESHLIDYDVESNWGNWNYLAGVGSDPRDRVFNVDRQAQMYDPDEQYRKKWLSSLIISILLFFSLSEVSVAQMMSKALLNVHGTPLRKCCDSPKTGYYRDGLCRTDQEDHGTHVACATVTEEFLEFTKSRGNDLSTPKPQFSFPGLRPGDKWCLCALRWLEAHRAGVAPLLDLEATDEKMLEYVPLSELKKKAH